MTLNLLCVFSLCFIFFFLCRAFFFQIDDPTSLNDFIASLHRDRYSVLRDERDAYHELQDQFSGEINKASDLVFSSTQERDKTIAEMEISKTKAADAQYALQNILTKFQVSIVFELGSVFLHVFQIPWKLFWQSNFFQ